MFSNRGLRNSNAPCHAKANKFSYTAVNKMGTYPLDKLVRVTSKDWV